MSNDTKPEPGSALAVNNNGINAGRRSSIERDGGQQLCNVRRHKATAGIWRVSCNKNANLDMSYSDLYFSLKSHAKVREAMRQQIIDRENESRLKKSADIASMIFNQDEEYYQRHIVQTSGTNTSYLPFIKREVISMTPEQIAIREERKREVLKDVSFCLGKALECI